LALRNKAVNYALDHGMAVTDAIIEKHSDAVVVVKEIVDLITEKRGPRTTPQAPPKPAPAPAPEPSKS
jgi:Ethanolamine utilization protein EutJ (predicted chaperonin)